jgi:hypothetical protein
MDREVSVVEAAPWATNQMGRKFFLATDRERHEMQAQLPNCYIVRAATEEEIDGLQGKTWEQMEAEEMAQAIAAHQ